MAYRQRFSRSWRFSLPWPRNDPSEVIQGQGHCGFWILATKFLLVSLSNYGSISHRLGAIGNYSCTWPRSRYVTLKGHSRSKVKVHFDRPGHTEHFCHRLRASVYMLWVILTFVTLKWPWKCIQGQRSWRSLTKSVTGNIFFHWHLCLQATGEVHLLRAKFTFVTWKWPLKRSSKVRSLQILKPSSY